MSMILILQSVSEDAAVEQDERVSIPIDSFNSWNDGMMFDSGDDENSISLEKAWHGLHFLLTGDPWAGSGHTAFLLCGGTEQGEDLGYGPARIIDAVEVSEIAKAIGGISTSQLWSRFDAQAMAAADIYGADRIDEPESDLQEEYFEYFDSLQRFLARTAEEGNALRIIMT